MSILFLPGASHQERDFSLDPKVLAALWKMEEKHFWHHARNRWIQDHLTSRGVTEGQRILEVGCGGGSVAGFLSKCGYDVTGVDTAETLVRKADERFPQVKFAVGDVACLPQELAGPYDVIAFFDVLEHLDEPLKLVRSALRFAAPNALVVVTVPGLQSLYSVIDLLAGHKRRYEVGEIAALLSQAGLQSVEEHGIFRGMLPILTRRRRAHPDGSPAPNNEAAADIMTRDLAVPPFVLNEALRLFCSLERRFFSQHSRDHRGASLIASGRLSHEHGLT